MQGLVGQKEKTPTRMTTGVVVAFFYFSSLLPIFWDAQGEKWADSRLFLQFILGYDTFKKVLDARWVYLIRELYERILTASYGEKDLATI